MKKVNIKLSGITLMLLAMIISTSATAGNKQQKKQWKQAEEYVTNDEFNNALNIYLELFQSDKQNSQLAYKIGYCYVSGEANQDIDACIDFLKMACENTTPKFKNSFSEKKAPVFSWYYLGVAYRLNKEYDKAIDCFNTYKQSMSKKDSKIIDPAFIDREIQSCKDAKESFDSDRMSIEQIIVTDLVDPYVRCPILSFDANRLIFTNGKYNVFPPDINWEKDYSDGPFDKVFTAKRDDDGTAFHSPEAIGKDLQISYPYIPVTATADGSELYLIVDRNDNGDIYMSKFENGKYQPAKKVKELNTRKWESHASITADGKRIYFTSMRKGGYGGLDIWYSDRDEDGKWQKPVNMGSTINTEFHEEMPYVLRNGNALYFSSEGHVNVGGFDVFYSNYNEQSKSWATPQNLGYPFSTAGNDMGYIIENTPIFAFCPVNDNKRREGVGECDCISLISEAVPQLATISGIIALDPDNENILMQTRVKLIDKATGQEVQDVDVDVDGSYKLVDVKSGSYDIIAYIPNRDLMSISINVPLNEEWDITGQNMTINIDDIIAANNQNDVSNQTYDEPVYCENVFFDFDKHDIKPEFYASLNGLAEWLKSNPETVIKLTGHTDHYGTELYNVDLSRRRAEMVATYLMDKGVANKQLIVKYEGELNGITIPVDEDHIRRLNRRVVFEIIVQGDPEMEVKPIIVPEEYRRK
jgi:outer membrane protein OmpA-like peptidoglycan-associated protein/tetratricopeptide (TPR) repeat protein